MNIPCHARRDFIRYGLAAAASPFLARSLRWPLRAGESPAGAASAPIAAGGHPKVAIAACRSYGPEVRAALGRCLEDIGGIQSLVRARTVTIKLNLTGTNFDKLFDRPVGESYMTHESTVVSLAALLKEAGAKRIRLVESTNRTQVLEETLVDLGWDVRELSKYGPVEFENTRNLGKGKTYAHLKVPRGGHMFSAFELNHAYDETDVLVSLCKLKNHLIAGVTLSLKNLFGITPNALYGDEAISEQAVAGRTPLHDATDFRFKLAGQKEGTFPRDPGWRVPRIVADLAAARPIHLAVIDGITSMSGGEGFWAPGIKFTTPGLLIVGRDPVATDAVGTAVMGYADPRAAKGTPPFLYGDNHLVLAEQLGAGVADLSRIEIRGLALQKARYPYPA